MFSDEKKNAWNFKIKHCRRFVHSPAICLDERKIECQEKHLIQQHHKFYQSYCINWYYVMPYQVISACHETWENRIILSTSNILFYRLYKYLKYSPSYLSLQYIVTIATDIIYNKDCSTDQFQLSPKLFRQIIIEIMNQCKEFIPHTLALH